MASAKTDIEADIKDRAAESAPNLDALLEELKAASKLMDDIAAAAEVLPPQYRRKADALGRNLKTLYQSGRRTAEAALSEPAEK